ncbi:MAG: hypothetical protein ACLTR6_12640 [Clostridium fessum]
MVQASLYEEPGCTTVFDVYLTNGSKHTYVYKNNSFTVSTPDMSNSDHTGVTGFDGQELPEDYTKGFLSPKYDIENASTTRVVEDPDRVRHFRILRRPSGSMESTKMEI